MVNKLKQEKLYGIEATMKRNTVADALLTIINQKTLTTLASELDIDPGNLSRFKNGEGGMTLRNIDKLLKHNGYYLMSEDRYSAMVNTIATLSDLMKEAMGL